jgi:hypothetical protein
MLSAYCCLGFFYCFKRSVGVYEISRFVNVEAGRFAGGLISRGPDNPTEILERSHRVSHGAMPTLDLMTSSADSMKATQVFFQDGFGSMQGSI